MSEAVRGLIVGHSSLGGGLVAAVRQISGADDGALSAISNDGMGPDGLLDAVREAAGDSPVIVFTDLPSGSCALAARKISIDRPKTGIICGVNLPMLIDFVFHRDMELPELVERLVQKGRGGITGTCTEEAAHADRSLSR